MISTAVLRIELNEKGIKQLEEAGIGGLITAENIEQISILNDTETIKDMVERHLGEISYLEENGITSIPQANAIEFIKEIMQFYDLID